MPRTERSLSAGTTNGSGAGAVPGRRLRKSRRPGCVEVDVAFDFLHQLMNMTIEHRHRTKALQHRERLLRIISAPAPILGYRAQWDVSEDDDRRGRGKALHIIGEPSQLLGPELAHAAGLEVHHIVETDKMDTVLVEGIPARALGVLAVALEIGLERHIVVLARPQASRHWLT